MVRYQDAVDAVLDAQPRVLARVDSLDDELALPEFAEAIDERPVHGGIRREHAGHVDAVVHRPVLDGWAGPLCSGTRRTGVRSFGRVRRNVSLLRPVVLSTVSAITEQPAASTRCRSCSQASQELGA